MLNNTFDNITNEQVVMLVNEFEPYLKDKTLDFVSQLFTCFDVFIGSGKQIDLEKYKIAEDKTGFKVLFLAFTAGFESKTKIVQSLH